VSEGAVTYPKEPYEAARPCPYCQGAGKELVIVQVKVIVFSPTVIGYAGRCGHIWDLAAYRIQKQTA